MSFKTLIFAFALGIASVPAWAVPYGDVGTTVASGNAADEPYRGPSPYMLNASQAGDSLVGFEEADNDASDTVNVREFELYQRETSGISPASARYQFNQLDLDGNGVLYRDEFPSVER